MEFPYTIIHLPARAKGPTPLIRGPKGLHEAPTDLLEDSERPTRLRVNRDETTPPPPPPPRLERAMLRRSEAGEVRGDPDRLVIPVMPLTLVGPDPTASDEALVDAADDGIPWGLRAVGADGSRFDGAGVRVAVLDSGLDLEHVAFAALRDEERIITRNFTLAADMSDATGHGTHCAGTICGGTVDGVRIGVAPRIDRLIVGKVLGPGSGTDILASAMMWAVAEMKADIVSMSLGLDFSGQIQSLIARDIPLAQATSMALEDYRDVLDTFRKLVDWLTCWDALIVAATGNESRRPAYTINVAPPAAVSSIVSVAALERRPKGLCVAPFSNTRPTVAAPGVNVRSARAGGGLVAKNGTSMAVPYVAGVAALWCQHLRQEQGELTRDAVRGKLVGSATLAGLHVDSRQSHDVGNGLVRVP